IRDFHVTGVQTCALPILIRASVLELAWNERLESFTSTFGGADLDASLLLMPEIGIIAARDPRFLSTLAACEKHLRFGNHLYRYQLGSASRRARPVSLGVA